MQKLFSCFSLFVREIFTINQKTRRKFFNLPFLASSFKRPRFLCAFSLPYDENELFENRHQLLEKKQVKSEENKLDFLHPKNAGKCQTEINFYNFAVSERERLLEHL